MNNSMLNGSILIEGVQNNADQQSVASAPVRRRRRSLGNEASQNQAENNIGSNEGAQKAGEDLKESSYIAAAEEEKEPQENPFAMDHDDNLSVDGGGNNEFAIRESVGNISVHRDKKGRRLGMMEYEDADDIDNNSVVSEDSVSVKNAGRISLPSGGMKEQVSESEEDVSSEIGRIAVPANNDDLSVDVSTEAKGRIQKANDAFDRSDHSIEIEGLNQIDMTPDWKAEALKERSKPSAFNLGRNLVSRGFGSTVLKLAALPVRLVGAPVLQGIAAGAVLAANKGQIHRTHQVIPGWNGKKFAPSKNQGSDILEDFRRVPTVWSYRTAAKADDADGHGTPLPPKITAYIKQPHPGSSRSMSFMEVGHAMLGVEYTRYSRITGRNERYNIKYGFYPATGYTDVSAAGMMLQGALMPGQLVNDRTHTFDISRTYPATNGQVESIIKESSSYADGGYGYYSRNCTTFVRDMFRVGGLGGVGDQIFQEEALRFNTIGNLGFAVGGMLSSFWNAGTNRIMIGMTKEDDQTYQGQGNKRLTGAEYLNYLDTREKGSPWGQKGLIPGVAGENMRRKGAEGSSMLSSYNYVGALTNDTTKNAATVDVDLYDFRDTLRKEARSFNSALEKIITPEQARNLSPDLYKWLMNLDFAHEYIYDLCNDLTDAIDNSGIKEEDYKNHSYDEFLKPSQIKTARQHLQFDMEKLTGFYNNELRSDSRINKKVMNYLSIMEIGLRALDNIYNRIAQKAGTGDLDSIRENALLNTMELKSGGKTVRMTPSHYESYLQIYGTPEKAVAAYARFLELAEERNGDDKNLKNFRILPSKKLDEYNELVKVETLAQEYDGAHRYMLEKEGFSQKDIDYAFSLRRKEMSGTVESRMYDNNQTMASVYIGLFLEKIFGGMREAAEKDPDHGGLPEILNKGSAAAWLDRFLTRKLHEKMKGMAMIVRGIKRATKRPTEERLKKSIMSFIPNMYLSKVFPSAEDRNKSGYMRKNLDKIFQVLTKESRFSREIEGVIRAVMLEDTMNVPVVSKKKKK